MEIKVNSELKYLVDSIDGKESIPNEEVYIQDNQPEDGKIWIDTGEISNLGTEVVNSLEGNQTNKAPSVNILKTTLGSAAYTNTTRLTDAGHCGWETQEISDKKVPSISLIAYWNGAHDAANHSNLEYVRQGKLGTIVTKSTTDYLSSSGGDVNGRTVFTKEGTTSVPTHLTSTILVSTTEGTLRPSIGFRELGTSDGTLSMRNRCLYWSSGAVINQHIPAANTEYEVIHTGNYPVINTYNTTETLVGYWGNTPIYRKAVSGTTAATTNNVDLASSVSLLLDSHIMVCRSGGTQYHEANNGMVNGGIEHASPIWLDTARHVVELYVTSPAFQGQQFYGWIEYTKL